MVFANSEQDTIKQSFSTGNHTWMKESLPVDLAPDSVHVLRRQRMERNRLGDSSRLKDTSSRRSHQEFSPDEFSRKHDSDMDDQRLSLEKQEKISSSGWRYCSQERRLKHEAMVVNPKNKELGTFPYLGGPKEMELQQQDSFLRSRASLKSWREETEPPVMHAFRGGKGNGLEDQSRTSRMTFPDMLEQLQKRLDADWEGTTVVASPTDQDLIQIAFHLPTVDSQRGVIAYMNVLSKDVDFLSGLGLRKVGQLWGVQHVCKNVNEHGHEAHEAQPEEDEDYTWIIFLLTPKWVHMRPTDAFYTVHPRSKGSTFKMSTAGQSVLKSLSLPSPPMAKRKPGLARRVNADEKLDLHVVEKAMTTFPSIKGRT